jgi:hypothetical protein
MLPTLVSSTTTPLRSSARRSSPATTSRQPQGEQFRRLAGTQPFERFGRWAPSVSVARDGTIGRLARWLALNRHEVGGDSLLWDRCQQANPECYRTYRVVTLDRPSYFLPAGEVAFEVIANPTQIPERPPQGVMLRHMEAMNAFAAATFYFLRPVFVIEPCFRLATVDELRREAYFDQFDAMRRARQLGWAYRGQHWLAVKRDTARLRALRALTRAVEELTWAVAPTVPGMAIDVATRRRLRRQFRQRLARTESLGLVQESRRLEFALRELQRRITIDPVLAFEVASRPGELWFEAHWFAGNDGRTYVHY